MKEGGVKNAKWSNFGNEYSIGLKEKKRNVHLYSILIDKIVSYECMG